MIEDVSIDLSVTVTKTEITKKFDPVISWGRYLLLENAFLNYLQYVPFKEEHYDITSPYLDDLLIRTCSLLESFWKYSAKFAFIANIIGPDDIEYIRENPKKSNINKLEVVFNKYYELNQKKLYYIFETYQTHFIPFENWSTEKAPDWWTKYNRLKHTGFDHSAKYIEVRSALGGLFLALVIDVNMIEYLHSISIIHGNPSFNECGSYLKKWAPRYERNNELIVTSRSKLFGYVYCHSTYSTPEKEDEINRYLFTPPFDLYSALLKNGIKP